MKTDRLAEYDYDDEERYTLPEFHKKFKDQLPLLAVVTEGFYGETKYDDYAADQLIRLHQATRQTRVLGRLAREAATLNDEFVTIPVKGIFQFSVVKGAKKVGKPQTMEQILKENKLPIQVRYAGPDVELRSMTNVVKEFNILIFKTYVDEYIQGNCLQMGALSPIKCLMALSPDISISIIRGYKTRPKSEFLSRMKSFQAFVDSNVNFELDEGSPDITRFLRGASTTGTGSPIPPDLLPRDYAHGGIYEAPPPQLVPRHHTSTHGADDDIYEPLPEPDPNWVPPRPTRPEKNERPLLPSRPYEPLQACAIDQEYHVINADEHTKVLPSDENYTYISSQFSESSDYFSSKDTWSAGSSRSHVTGKTVQEITDILHQLNLKKFEKEFKSNLVDGEVLEALDEKALREDFKFTHVEAVRLMKYVRAGHIPR